MGLAPGATRAWDGCRVRQQLGPAGSLALDQFAVVAGIQGRDRRGIDCRMLQTCFNSRLSDPLQLEELFDQADGIRCHHGQDPGGLGRRIGEPVADASRHKDKGPGRPGRRVPLRPG